ncbi:MAG: hypothetical protein LBI32_04920 [Myroides odoratus]|jgi:hypothetical protein|nr:hypothetical protein [Myroides odoratus]
MKKLFMFLAVAGLATFGASCSSDDSKGGDDLKQLSISSDAKNNTVVEGSSVTFTAKVGDKVESGATFYVDGTKATNPYKFEKEGSYSVVAKKDKFKDSAAITIKVEKPGVAQKSLVLTSDKETVKVGEKVTFTVKDNEGAVISDAVIKQGNVAVEGNSWTATAEGAFKFKATKDGYVASGEAVVVVEPAPAAFVLTLVTNPDDVYGGEVMELSIKTTSGVAVADAVLFLNGNATTIKSNAEGIYRITPNIGGDYVLQSKKGNDVSNVLTVVVKDPKTPETQITGTFVYKGTTYNVQSAQILLDGIYYADATETSANTWWNLLVVGDNNRAFMLEFFTPATGNAQEGFNIVEPTTSNTTQASLAMINTTGQGSLLDQATTGITMSFGATPNQAHTVYTGRVTSGATLGGAAFTHNMNGEMLFGRVPEQGNATAMKKQPSVKSALVTKASVRKATNAVKVLNMIKK